jgi:hypothetical protein
MLPISTDRMVRLDQILLDYEVLLEVAVLLKQTKAIGHVTQIKHARKAASPSRKCLYLALLLFFRCHACQVPLPLSIKSVFAVEYVAPNFRRPFLATKKSSDQETMYVKISPSATPQEIKKATLELFAQELDGYWVSVFEKLKSRI